METKIKTLAKHTLDAKKLPSRGVGYPEGMTFSFYSYAWGEIKAFSITKMDYPTSIKKVMAGITPSVEFDMKKIFLVDAFYLGIARRLASLSAMQAEMPYQCRSCESINKVVFTQKDIIFNDLSEEVQKLPISATIEGKEILLRPMVLETFYELHEGKYKSAIRSDGIDEIAINASWVTNMSFKEAYDLFYMLDKEEDTDVLHEIETLFKMDMKPLEHKCPNPKCGKENTVKVAGRESFIMPFRSGNGDVRRRISLK